MDNEFPKSNFSEVNLTTCWSLSRENHEMMSLGYLILLTGTMKQKEYWRIRTERMLRSIKPL